MQTQHRVWVKRFDWLSAIVIPESVGLSRLPEIATTKPPYRLQGMASIEPFQPELQASLS